MMWLFVLLWCPPVLQVIEVLGCVLTGYSSYALARVVAGHAVQLAVS